MKNLFIFLTLIFSITANAEFNSFDSFFDYNQEGKIEAAYLDMLSSDLTKAKAAYLEKLETMPEPFDMTEGKIQASLINMIDSEIEKAETLLVDLAYADSIDDASTLELRESTVLIIDLTAEL